MQNLTGIQFPLPKLTVVSAYFDIEATHSSGLIVLKETLIEHPNYAVTYTTLVREVVEQWISNILTICSPKNTHFCAQVSFHQKFI